MPSRTGPDRKAAAPDPERAAPQRLDKTLAARGLFESRSRAAEAIRLGLVAVDGVTVDKPSIMLAPGARIDVTSDPAIAPALSYVSRGALKLLAALDAFAIGPAGRTCLDIGASTGGFCEVLLQRGAACVFAVDVGHGQLHPRVEADPRIVNLEKTNSRDLDAGIITTTPDLITCDVSFISLRKALPAALALAGPGAHLVTLIKPQFELGRASIGKGGRVTAGDDQLTDLCNEIASWLTDAGWRTLGVIDSPIRGGDGNREFLIGAQRS